MLIYTISENKKYKKIDIHCHTTNRALQTTMSKSASLDTIVQKMEKYNIEKTLVLATYFPLKGTGISNFRLRHWIDRNNIDKFLMFGSLDFNYYFKQGVNELLDLISQELISGIKIYSGYQDIKEEFLYKILNLCNTYELPIMFHTGDCTGLDNIFADIASYDKYVEEFPTINFIFSHLNNPRIDNIIERVKRYKNVYTDMSGLLHSGKDDHELSDHILSLKKFYNECGTSQLLWGTDFPVTTHEHSIYIAEEALHNMATEDELKQFYYGNATKLLKI